MTRRERIERVIRDSIPDIIYYMYEDFPLAYVEEAIKAGEITVDEMIEIWADELRKELPLPKEDIDPSGKLDIRGASVTEELRNRLGCDEDYYRDTWTEDEEILWRCLETINNLRSQSRQELEAREIILRAAEVLRKEDTADGS